MQAKNKRRCRQSDGNIYSRSLGPVISPLKDISNLKIEEFSTPSQKERTKQNAQIIPTTKIEQICR